MVLLDGIDHCTRAKALVHELVEDNDPLYGAGTMTVSLYDTAWVSMVSRGVDGSQQWLYPEAFEYLLRAQDQDGGWHTSPFAVDSILNTLAALLALCRHIAEADSPRESIKESLFHRRNRTIYYLDERLCQWNIDATVSNGFEILVPKLLELLSAEGIDFNFPGLHKLEEMRDATLASFDPTTLYNFVRSSFAQYLEGFIGDVDFDQVAPQISGSMMGSPAATAAYLIYSNIWDSEAETYLDCAMAAADYDVPTKVAALYPTSMFEVSYALSTLLANGFDNSQIGERSAQSAIDLLEVCLSIDGGVIGSAPNLEPDAGITSKLLSTLSLLGRSPSPEGLISKFDTQEFFKTNAQELKPSFSTNCLALKALLDLIPENCDQGAQIERIVRFLEHFWWTTNGQIEDTTNFSPTYPTMLMVDVFTHLVDLWDKGLAPFAENLAVKDKVVICLYQALMRTLQIQNLDGSWGCGKRCETTAYAVLTLTKLSGLSSAQAVRTQTTHAIEAGRQFLIQSFSDASEPEHIWCGKTTAGSKAISQAHVLAALQAPVSMHISRSVEIVYQMPLAKLAVNTKYFARQPWFAHMQEWQVQACLVQSQLFLPQLKSIQFAIFPKSSVQDDRYFETIPFMWLAANSYRQRMIAPEYLYQMMMLTFLNRQLSDFLSHHIHETFAGCLFELEDVLHQIFERFEVSEEDSSYYDQFDPSSVRSSTTTVVATAISEVHAILSKFVAHVLKHQYIVMASIADQANLRLELLSFLIGRIYRSDKPQRTSVGTASRDVDLSGDQTHHNYTFAFLSCLVGNQRVTGETEKPLDFLETPEQQYLASAMCRHISIINFLSSNANERSTTMRGQSPRPTTPGSQWSWNRRGQNSSISSISTTSTYSNGGVSPASMLSSNSSAPPSVSPMSEHFHKPLNSTASNALQFLRLLIHERRCLEVCLQDLHAAAICSRTANVIGLFSDVSDLAGQIFCDPNIGSFQQPVTASDVIEQPCNLQPAPIRAKKSVRKGSVGHARAGLTLEVPKPKHEVIVKQAPPIDPPTVKSTLKPKIESQKKKATSSRLPSSLQSEEISQPRSAPATQQTFSLDPSFPVPKLEHSRNSIEMSRIEKIMSEMGEGDKTGPSTTNSHAGAKPTKDPKLHHSPQTRGRAATTGDSIYMLPSRKGHEAQRRLHSAPTLPSADSEGIRMAKARLQIQRNICKELDKQLADNDKALEKHKQLEVQRRATEVQQQAKLNVVKLVPTMPRPGLSKSKIKKSEIQRVRFVGDEDEERRMEAKGWTRSPPPEKPGLSFMDFDVEDGEGRRGKLRRKRGVGPKLKLPF